MGNIIEKLIFRHRVMVLLGFSIVTLLMLFSATGVRLDAGFKKLLPAKHEFMQTFLDYRRDFGGANRVLIAVTQKQGDIFNESYFTALKKVTDAVFFIDGVERSSVTSLFTPNVRFIEVVEGGFTGGNVIPAEFKPTPDGFNSVRENILKTGKLGILVSADFRSAIVSATLVETNEQTGQRVDYLSVAKQLESIRQTYSNDNLQIHIIGFSKLIGDVVDAFGSVFLFFFITLIVTALLLYAYTRSFFYSLFPIICSLTAVVWLLGLLPLLGYGIDPMSILLPFLIFAIGISHAVQMVNATRLETMKGCGHYRATRKAFRGLLLPGSIALLSDTIGFLTIILIDIEIIRELAIAASMGIAMILLTNLFLLPLLLSYVSIAAEKRVDPLFTKVIWQYLTSIISQRKYAAGLLSGALILLCYGLWVAKDMGIGDLESGAPELHQQSQYNQDIQHITKQFYIGVDVLTVIVETSADACTVYDVMNAIDQFAWYVRNIEGVHTTMALPIVAKVVSAGWYEGSLKWRVLSRNKHVLAQSVYPVDTSSGLLNGDCSAMSVNVYTKDHKAETITRIVDGIKQYAKTHPSEKYKFRLASGNVGIMAATNEVVSKAQFPMLLNVYAAIILLCLIGFRSLLGTLCIIIPLALVSVLTYALMVYLNIGLKVATLPVIALGVGIGVDYGIYIFSRFRQYALSTTSIKQAFLLTFTTTGNAVLFTGMTLAIGVSTWVFSPLKFQADMGVLLSFVFLANMLAAIVLLPSLAVWLLAKKRHGKAKPAIDLYQ